MENKEASVLIVMSVKRKRSVLSTKDKQSIIVRLERGEKGSNLSAELVLVRSRSLISVFDLLPFSSFSFMFSTR